MIRTFVDSGVLVAASRGDRAESEPALRLREDPSLEWASDLHGVVHLAISEAERYGLSALDALHAAAALLLGEDQFVTTEKFGKPIYRVSEVPIIHITDAILA